MAGWSQLLPEVAQSPRLQEERSGRRETIVLIVIHGPTFGGAHNQALRLADPLRRIGVRTIVVLNDQAIAAKDRLLEGGIEVLTMPLVRPRASLRPEPHLRLAAGFLKDVQNLRHLMQRLKPDIVQIESVLTPQAAIAARLERVPVVCQLIDTRPPRLVRQLLAPLAVSLSDVIMTTGSRVADMYPGVRSMGDRLIPFIPPVDLSSFRPSLDGRVAARHALGVKSDQEVVIGALGNRNPQKGYEYLIRAVALVIERHPTVCLRIIGNRTLGHGDYERRLVRLLDAAGISRQAVQSLPAGLAVADALNAFDVMALSSRPNSEGIPTVVLEAMACGVPVVATDVGSVREVVDDGITGFVVPSQEPGSMSHALCRIVEDEPLRHRMSQGAHAAAKNWGVAACARTHEAAYALARLPRVAPKQGL